MIWEFFSWFMFIFRRKIWKFSFSLEFMKNNDERKEPDRFEGKIMFTSKDV